MNPDNEYQDYLEKYLSGEIAEADFNLRLVGDAGLRQEYDLYLKELEVIQSAGKEVLKEKARLLLQQQKQKGSGILNMRFLLKAAAVFLLLIAAYFLLKDELQPSTTTELFAANFELPPPSNGRNGSSDSELWKDAMAAYTNQDYPKAIALISSGMEQAGFTYTEPGKLYLGLSYLMVNEPKNAVAFFEKISGESSYADDASWYRALTLLKMDDTAAAKVAFQRIAANPRHYQQKSALKILNQLQ